MPRPDPFPCGQVGQPACPPQPALASDPPTYTLHEMRRYGWECYLKGKDDALARPVSTTSPTAPTGDEGPR